LDKNILNTQHFKDFTLSVIFGILSTLLSLVKFNIPGFGAAISSLNEIPLLISVFYLSNPFYLIIAVVISALTTPEQGSIYSTILMHSGGLAFFGIYYHLLLKRVAGHVLKSIVYCALGIAIYYAIFLMPIFIITNQILGLNETDFIPFYTELSSSLYFEFVTSLLVVTLFLVQFNYSRKLKKYSTGLVGIVSERTEKLRTTVEELNRSNEELTSLNDGLDLMVKNRTAELEERNYQLTEYAFINSHLLRAPLARVLGLTDLIRMESTDPKTGELMDRLFNSCEELDEIIKLMSTQLSDGSILSSTQKEELKNKINEIIAQRDNVNNN
jgi:signal transduction histidine kinase